MEVFAEEEEARIEEGDDGGGGEGEEKWEWRGRYYTFCTVNLWNVALTDSTASGSGSTVSGALL